VYESVRDNEHPIPGGATMIFRKNDEVVLPEKNGIKEIGVLEQKFQDKNRNNLWWVKLFNGSLVKFYEDELEHNTGGLL
jgi:hypothetical protein